MKKVYADEIIRVNNKLYTKAYAENNSITGELVTESIFDLRGQKIVCNYSQIFYPDSNMILCNEIPSVDPYFFDNIVNGSFEYCEDIDGNIFTYDEAQEKIEEIERELEELDEDNDENKDFIIEAKENIEALEDVHQQEIFQYFIIDEGTADRLKASTNELIFYCEKLDLYILGVMHYGTAWDYVRTEFTL